MQLAKAWIRWRSIVDMESIRQELSKTHFDERETGQREQLIGVLLAYIPAASMDAKETQIAEQSK